MRLTQGMFSFLPDLTDDEIALQVDWFIDKGNAVSIEYTDDPHPRNTYWEMWTQPMFDLASSRPFMESLAECRRTLDARGGQYYVRVVAFDNTKGWESPRASFLVGRPDDEPGFGLERTVGAGRMQHYRTRSYATDRPAGARYA